MTKPGKTFNFRETTQPESLKVNLEEMFQQILVLVAEKKATRPFVCKKKKTNKKGSKKINFF